jgi:hypothetical protein
MYITNHRIESDEERLSILESVHSEPLGFGSSELFFCVMDEEEIVGWAAVSSISAYASSLEALVLLEKYRHIGIELNLLKYVAFELLRLGKSYLVITKLVAAVDDGEARWIEQISDRDLSGQVVIKIDGFTAREQRHLAS